MSKKSTINRVLVGTMIFLLAMGIVLGHPRKVFATTISSDVGDVHIIESRTVGVAPLAVHFEAEATSEEFHSKDYTWDFGDSAGGNWGTNNNSKNSAKGAISAHVFETPGTYEVTLTVKNGVGDIQSAITQIIVEDPEEIYVSQNTTCVNPAGDNDFSKAPAGARLISTDNLSEITQYAATGSRILLKRGASWTIHDLVWPEVDGPVTIGAYGEGNQPDSFGIYENAPLITVNSGGFFDIGNHKDWRIMDLAFVDETKSNNVIGGVYLSQKNLFLRLKTVGFAVPIGWSHWIDPNGEQISEMSIVSCNVMGARDNVAYVGSERLALLGNQFADADNSHVVRVWQAYKSVISNNKMSGSSLKSNSGRHSFKMHGPSGWELVSKDWDCLKSRTEYTIVSDNVFGSSGPWPVSIGPQDDWKDERLSDIIFERNRYCADFGKRSSDSVQLDTALLFLGRQITIRNNIIDGSNFGAYFTGICVRAETVAPPSQNIWIYHNTIYKSNNLNGQDWTGIKITQGAKDIVVKNNLISFPAIGTGSQQAIDNDGTATIQSNNLLNGNIAFVDPDNAIDPLNRSFQLTSNSVDAINKGNTIKTVFEDFEGNERPGGSAYDIGALEAVEQPPTVEELLSPQNFVANVTSDPLAKVEVLLSWSHSDQVNGYEIQRKEASLEDDAYITVAIIDDKDAFGYSDGSIKNNRIYNYRICARKDLVKSDWVYLQDVVRVSIPPLDKKHKLYSAVSKYKIEQFANNPKGTNHIQIKNQWGEIVDNSLFLFKSSSSVVIVNELGEFRANPNKKISKDMAVSIVATLANDTYKRRVIIPVNVYAKRQVKQIQYQVENTNVSVSGNDIYLVYPYIDESNKNRMVIDVMGVDISGNSLNTGYEFWLSDKSKGEISVSATAKKVAIKNMKVGNVTLFCRAKDGMKEKIAITIHILSQKPEVVNSTIVLNKQAVSNDEVSVNSTAFSVNPINNTTLVEKEKQTLIFYAIKRGTKIYRNTNPSDLIYIQNFHLKQSLDGSYTIEMNKEQLASKTIPTGTYTLYFNAYISPIPEINGSSEKRVKVPITLKITNIKLLQTTQ